MGSGKAPMKDLEIVELGMQGDEVEISDSRLLVLFPSAKITLSLEFINQANFELLNYPLRPEPRQA
jgi:uncharacterized cupredoxin-like copper-binding protein